MAAEEVKQHATLGASSCDRWWNCPGSIRLSRDLPSTSSSYAAEGSAAHALAEACLRDGIDAEDMTGRVVLGFEVTDEMAQAVKVYLDYLRPVMTTEGIETWLEQRIDLDKLGPPAPMFGTADFIAYDAADKLLTVVDYKHGAGYPVEVKGNPQLRYYGVGAALKFSHLRFSRIKLVIVQPRAPHRDGPIREDVVDAVDLLEWAMELTVKAGDTLKPNAPLAIGGWCKFCPASAVCPLVREKSLAEAKADFAPLTGEIILPDSPQGLSLEQIARILDHADMIGDWLNAVRTYAHAQAEAGIPVPGYKLVPKRATRKWKDEGEAMLALDLLGVPSEDMMTEPKLKSPAQVEKLLGAKRKGEITPYVVAESTGTNLVREETSRLAVPHSAARDFTPIEGPTA